MDSTSYTTTRDYQELPIQLVIVHLPTTSFAKLKFTSVLQTNLVARAPVIMKNVGIVRIQQGIVQVVNRDTRVTNVNSIVMTECLETCVKASVDIV